MSTESGRGGIIVITRNSTKFCSSVRCVCSGFGRGHVRIRQATKVPTFVTTNTLTNLRVIGRRRRVVIVPKVLATRRLSGGVGANGIVIVVGLSRYIRTIRAYVQLRPRAGFRCFRGIKAKRRFCASSQGRVREGVFPCFSLVVVR